MTTANSIRKIPFGFTMGSIKIQGTLSLEWRWLQAENKYHSKWLDRIEKCDNLIPGMDLCSHLRSIFIQIKHFRFVT